MDPNVHRGLWATVMSAWVHRPQQMAPLVGVLIVGEAACVSGQGVPGSSLFLPRVCCEPKTAPKNKRSSKNQLGIFVSGIFFFIFLK